MKQLPLEIFLVLGIGASVASLIGFIDDIKNIRVSIKLILQILLMKVMEAQSFILAMLLLIQIFNFMLIITRFVIPLIIIELTANL